MDNGKGRTHGGGVGRPHVSGRDNSLEGKLVTLQRYAQRRRLALVRSFSTSREGRSQLDAMMAEATGEQPPFRQLLVPDIGRLSQRADDPVTLYLPTLAGNGVAVVSIKE